MAPRIPQPKTVTATFYVQVEPEWSKWKRTGDNEVVLDGAKASRITLRRPDNPLPGVVITRLTLELPASAFLPLQPQVVVAVPEFATETIEVTASHPDAIEGDDDSE